MNLEASQVIESLGLLPHPEGGFFRETYRAPLVLQGLPHGSPRAAHTAIYFLLPAGTFSAFHRVASDEVWHHYQGDPIALHLITESGDLSTVRLGHDIPAGELPQHVVPAGVWQAAVPLGDTFALCGCTVAPGFDFADFEMPTRTLLLHEFAGSSEIVRRAIERFTRDS